MFKPRKPPNEEPSQTPSRIRRDALPSAPKLAQVREMLDEATNKRGCLMEQPFGGLKAGQSLILTVQWDRTAKEPVWILYQEEGGQSSIAFTESFPPDNLDFLSDLLAMYGGSSVAA